MKEILISITGITIILSILHIVKWIIIKPEDLLGDED